MALATALAQVGCSVARLHRCAVHRVRACIVCATRCGTWECDMALATALAQGGSADWGSGSVLPLLCCVPPL